MTTSARKRLREYVPLPPEVLTEGEMLERLKRRVAELEAKLRTGDFADIAEPKVGGWYRVKSKLIDQPWEYIQISVVAGGVKVNGMYVNPDNYRFQGPLPCG